MNADNRDTIASIISLHKQKEFRSIFKLSCHSLIDLDLKRSYYELTRRVHPDKNGNSPESTLAQQNLADAYESLQRERERERERKIEREIEKKKRIASLIKRKRKRDEKRMSLTKIEIKRIENLNFLNHLLMTAVLGLFYLRVMRKDSIMLRKNSIMKK